MKEYLTVKNVSVGFVIIICCIFGITPYVGAGKVDGLKAGITEIIQEVMKDTIEAVEMNTEFRVDEYVKLILKNAKKITTDPDDVKASDIDLCISYLPKIPDERKDEYLCAQIDIIIAWKQQNP